MRTMLRAAMLMLIVLAVSETGHAQDLTQVIRTVQPSVVTIVAYDVSGRPISQGTGFFIGDDGEVVTNFHVVQGAYRATVRFASGDEVPVRGILGDSEDWDLARLRVDSGWQQITGLPLASKLPEVGTRVIVVGSPLGMEQTVSDGIISAVRTVPSGGHLLQLTAPISSGSSGSPVLDAVSGEVVGVATASFREGQGLNVAVPSSALEHAPRRPMRILSTWSADHRRMNTRRSGTTASTRPVVAARTRVRVFAPNVHGSVLVGESLRVQSNTMVFRPEAFRGELQVPFSDIVTLEVSRGQKDQGVLFGVLGGLGLGGVGAVLAWKNTLGIDCQPTYPGGDGICQLSPAERAGQGLLIGAFLGGLGGWALGATIRSESWEQILPGRPRR